MLQQQAGGGGLEESLLSGGAASSPAWDDVNSLQTDILLLQDLHCDPSLFLCNLLRPEKYFLAESTSNVKVIYVAADTLLKT